MVSVAREPKGGLGKTKARRPRAEPPTRVAAIDVGTNTIRCMVVEVLEDGAFRVLDEERALVRLGEGLSASGVLSPGAFARASEALGRMRHIVDGYGVSVIDAVATSAVRRAGNGLIFVQAMERETGIPIRVISGEEEAELAVLSARYHFETPNGRFAMLDIGGGSVEIILAAGEHVEEVVSLDLGAVVLTERFFPDDPIRRKDFDKMRRFAEKQLRKTLGEGEVSPRFLIGSGGTVTAIANMAMALRGERYDSAHRYEVLRSEVVHLLAMLRHQSLKERLAVPGLNPDRADIIVAGVAVVDAVMDHLGANVLTVNERGVREGLVLSILAKHGLRRQSPVPRDWRSAVDSLARSCHVDLVHASHVRDLALSLFESLSERYELSPRARDVLEAAAVLHDIGYFIGYDKHHKHAYHLLKHADLLGFTPREKEVIASVARYHRKSLPKRTHEGFGQLGRSDRGLVRRLGGLLRLADGLDRRRIGKVKALLCRVQGDDIEVALRGDGDLSVELYGGREKGDLFEEAFGKKLVLSAEAGAVDS